MVGELSHNVDDALAPLLTCDLLGASIGFATIERLSVLAAVDDGRAKP